ncbi:hypothetical protein [Intestinibacillus sp. Marseille-P6563]|uniref:hypothetical protein n=1 Tax=Intestinibacillus sp. Marseille-P6563 TaxID=2364792 RepID=UPI000F05217B|nr:hypothetical protein [Intestinibacillus sp. Marseille-P6563]
MKFVTISSAFYEKCSDSELLQKGNRRPHVLVLSLTYKGKRANFAVPLRSNIPPSAPRTEYFPLPPRATTKPKHRHGLHYIKMFPITKDYQQKFWVGENKSYVLYQNIISQNQKQIVQECQAYLDRYAAGDIPPYSVNIDRIFETIHSA